MTYLSAFPRLRSFPVPSPFVLFVHFAYTFRLKDDLHLDLSSTITPVAFSHGEETE
jgi:hypothetical protein